MPIFRDQAFPSFKALFPFSALPAKNSQYAIELLLTQPDLLESLRKAHLGNYGMVMGLLGCLEQGVKAKKLVDRVIDSCGYRASPSAGKCRTLMGSALSL